MRPRWTWPHPQIDALRGQVAVERGPLVYCLESVDLGEGVDTAQVDTAQPPVEEDGRILVLMRVTEPAQPAWPYRYDEPVPAPASRTRLTPLVPYHRWGNRGPSTMRVWIPSL
jgi:DUF1680 family protein